MTSWQHTAIAGILLGATGLAAAALPPGHPLPETGSRTEVGPTFDELDRNNDGVLSPSELPADHELASRFASFDRDGDNALSRGEFELYMSGDDSALAAGDEDDDDDEEEEEQ